MKLVSDFNLNFAVDLTIILSSWQRSDQGYLPSMEIQDRFRTYYYCIEQQMTFSLYCAKYGYVLCFNQYTLQPFTMFLIRVPSSD